MHGAFLENDLKKSPFPPDETKFPPHGVVFWSDPCYDWLRTRPVLSQQISTDKEDDFVTEQEFGQRLRQYRREKRLTQQELAELLGVSNKSVSRWESGSYPDVATLAPLARALGVTVDELLGGQPPLRELQRSDWQNLLSYGFALGGGVLFYLLDLFLPGIVSYLIYLAMMAYGIYLQRHYTYHSRWFYGANALMNLFINIRMTSFLAAARLGLTAQWLTLQFGGVFSAGPGKQLALLWDFLKKAAPAFLPQLAAVAVLSAGTQLVIWRTAGHKVTLPKLRFRLGRASLSWSKALPALVPFLLVMFWCIYLLPFPLPEWVYDKQLPLFLGVWAALGAAAVFFLIARRRWGMLAPAVLMQLCCLGFPGLREYTRVFSRISGRLIDYAPNLNVQAYIRIGQASWGMLLAAAVLAALYLACCLVRIEVSPQESE